VSAGGILKSVGLDRYDINARLRPALFAVLPVFAVALFWIPEARTLGGAAVSLLSICGGTYFMTRAARMRGRTVERGLGEKAGRAHSARLLTHGDTTFATQTKARYHDYLRSHGLEILSADQERSEPGAAFDRARSAVDWLLEHTRPNAKTSLLYDENIAYGFQRNLLGLKPVGIAACALTLVAHAALLWFRPLEELAMMTGVLIALALVVMLALWILFVTRSSVTEASLAYAQRLFSQCEAGSRHGSPGGEPAPAGKAAKPRTPKRQAPRS
jgi:hypothetical protein